MLRLCLCSALFSYSAAFCCCEAPVFHHLSAGTLRNSVKQKPEKNLSISSAITKAEQQHLKHLRDVVVLFSLSSGLKITEDSAPLEMFWQLNSDLVRFYASEAHRHKSKSNLLTNSLPEETNDFSFTGKHLSSLGKEEDRGDARKPEKFKFTVSVKGNEVWTQEHLETSTQKISGEKKTDRQSRLTHHHTPSTTPHCYCDVYVQMCVSFFQTNNDTETFPHTEMPLWLS